MWFWNSSCFTEFPWAYSYRAALHTGKQNCALAQAQTNSMCTINKLTHVRHTLVRTEMNEWSKRKKQNCDENAMNRFYMCQWHAIMVNIQRNRQQQKRLMQELLNQITCNCPKTVSLTTLTADSKDEINPIDAGYDEPHPNTHWCCSSGQKCPATAQLKRTRSIKSFVTQK